MRRVRLHARGHALLGSGGGGIGDGVDADLVRKCCSVGSCCSRRAPGSWGRLRAGGGPLDDVVLGTALSVQGEQYFKSVLSDEH